MALAIRVSDVSKRFNLHHDKSLKERLINLRRTDTIEPFWALQHVSFELEQSHTLGLIGANGSGKSTLLKLIGGILTPNEGYVERRGRIAALLELGSGFHPDLTGRENVYMNASILGLTRKQTDAYFDEILLQLDAAPDTRIFNLPIHSFPASGDAAFDFDALSDQRRRILDLRCGAGGSFERLFGSRRAIRMTR